MPVDSPEEIERQRDGDGKSGSTFFYWILFICMVFGMAAIYANQRDGVSQAAPAPNGVSQTQVPADTTTVQPEEP